MSYLPDTGSNNSFDIEELSQIRARSIELTKEKDLLNASQAQSFQLIRRLELHVKTLLEAQKEDRKHIQELERELSNCSQEIEYLQDQLNARNAEVQCLGDHIHFLELKLSDMENLEEMVGDLNEELKRSDSERLFLNHELQNKAMELKKSTICIERLEDSILSVSLEYQCELESMKLDLMALEQSCFETNKIQEEDSQEKGKLDQLLKDMDSQIQDSRKVIECLDEENKELREKLKTAEVNARSFCRKLEERYPEWFNKDVVAASSDVESDTSTSGNILGPLLSRLVEVGEPDAALKEKIENMSLRIHEYEILTNQLKEELREEKLKAHEEAEDLAQEMAELRYQITGLLEEECRRRAYVEHVSVNRIAELEAQIERERQKSFAGGCISVKFKE